MVAGTAVLMFPLGMVAVALITAVILNNVIEQLLIWIVSGAPMLSVIVTGIAPEQGIVIGVPLGLDIATFTPVTLNVLLEDVLDVEPVPAMFWLIVAEACTVSPSRPRGSVDGSLVSCNVPLMI